MITCGYCETQNNNDNQSCVSCGGSLADEITQKRNEELYIAYYPHNNNIIAKPLVCAKKVTFGVTADEFYNSIRQVFG